MTLTYNIDGLPKNKDVSLIYPDSLTRHRKDRVAILKIRLSAAHRGKW